MGLMGEGEGEGGREGGRKIGNINIEKIGGAWKQKEYKKKIEKNIARKTKISIQRKEGVVIRGGLQRSSSLKEYTFFEYVYQLHCSQRLKHSTLGAASCSTDTF